MRKKLERSNKKEDDWEDIITPDQLSGSRLTGVESGEATTMSERQTKDKHGI